MEEGGEEAGALTSAELLENYFEQPERVLPEAGAEVGVGINKRPRQEGKAPAEERKASGPEEMKELTSFKAPPKCPGRDTHTHTHSHSHAHAHTSRSE